MVVVKKLVLEHKIDVNIETYSLQTSLSLACRYGYLVVVKLLLDNNADVNKRHRMMSSCPLQTALNNNHFIIAKLLVDNGAQILTWRGNCFLIDYCLKNNIEAMRFLLEYTDAKFYIDKIVPGWNASPISIVTKKTTMN